MKYGSSSETRQKLKMSVDQNAVLFMEHLSQVTKAVSWEAAIAEKRNGCSSPRVTIPQPSGAPGAAVPKLPTTHVRGSTFHTLEPTALPRQGAGRASPEGCSPQCFFWAVPLHLRHPEEQLAFPKPDLGHRLAIDALFQRIDLNPCFQTSVCKQSNFLHTSDQGDSSGTGRARTGPVQQEETKYCYFK